MAACALSTAASTNCWGTNWWTLLLFWQTQLSSNSYFLSLLSSWVRQRLYKSKVTSWRRRWVPLRMSFCWSHFSRIELWQSVGPCQQCNSCSHSRLLMVPACTGRILSLQCRRLGSRWIRRVSLNCTECRRLSRERVCRLKFVLRWAGQNPWGTLWLQSDRGS